MIPLKVLNVVGCRHGFLKIAPLMAEMRRSPEIEPLLLATGAEFSGLASDPFFQGVRFPVPDLVLEVAPGSHAQQTAAIMNRFENALLETTPDVVVVVGDANPTLATSMTAVKMGIPVARIESGLRSFNRENPEEINRLMTDAISDFLFVSEVSAVNNLTCEGIPASRIRFVGNILVDQLLSAADRILQSPAPESLGLERDGYVVLSLQREDNLGDTALCREASRALRKIQERLPIVFPASIQTVARLHQLGLWQEIGELENVHVIDPPSYPDHVALIKWSRMTWTDDGRVQDETTALRVPCLTLGDTTERPVTVSDGTNTLVGTDADTIVAESMRILRGAGKIGQAPPMWDGRSASRIVKELLREREALLERYRNVRDSHPSKSLPDRLT